MNVNTMHLFAGGGGGLISDLIVGHNPICAVEWEPAACAVLRERAADGWFPDLYVYEGDVRMFDPSEYAGRIHTLCAGFPCTDISVAGKQAGIGAETSSGLYREVIRCIRVVRPSYVFMENVTAIISLRQRISLIVIEKIKQLGLFGAQDNQSFAGRYIRRIINATEQAALGYVLGDLVQSGYDCRWICLRASDVGANHHRDRWWLLARWRDGVNRNSNSVNEAAKCEIQGRENTKPSGTGGTGNVRHSQHAERGDILSHSELCRAGRREQQQEGIEGTSGEQCADVANTTGAGLQDGRQPGRNTRTAEAGAGLEPEPKRCGEDVPDTLRSGQQGQGEHIHASDSQTDREGQASDALNERERPEREAITSICGMDDVLASGLVQSWWEVEPNVGRVTDENNNRAAQLKMLGNGQVPLQCAVAHSILIRLFN